MNYFSLLYLLCLGLNCVLCAPIEKSLYDAIAEKCPSINSLTTNKDFPLFKFCKDWKVISQVDKLTENNRRDILCLLYFESFTQYCTQTQTPNTTTSIDVNLNGNLDKICDYAKTTSNKNLTKIFTTEDNCKKICTDEMGLVESVCSISFYFAHATVSNTETNEKSPQQKKPDASHPSELTSSKIEPTTENKQKEPADVQTNDAKKSKTDPKNTDNIKAKLNTPLPQPILIPEEGKANPSKDVNNVAKADLGKPVPPNPDMGEVPSGQGVAANSDEVEAPPGQVDPANPEGPKVPSVTPTNKNKIPGAENVQVHQNVKENVGNKNDANPDQSEVQSKPEAKPVQSKSEGNSVQSKPGTTNNAEKVQNKAPEIPAKPQVKADDHVQGKKEDHNQESQEMQNQDGVLNNLDQDRNDQNSPIENSEFDNNMDEDGQDDVNLETSIVHSDKFSKPSKVEDSEPANYATDMDGDSYFFTYFMLLCIIFIVGYVCYHNKQKVLALILEGRKGKRQYRGRRPNSANYHKLDSNLEEAITSSCKKNTTNVIY